jgi:hypothetical protein
MITIREGRITDDATGISVCDVVAHKQRGRKGIVIAMVQSEYGTRITVLYPDGRDSRSHADKWIKIAPALGKD